MKPVAPKPTLRKPKGPENKWTPEEDEVLAAAVAASGFKVCWRKIALSLPGRTNKSCRKRWIHSLDPTLRKGRWTAQEDKILLNAIKQHGTLWYKVAKHLPGRTDDQAAKRFREKLDPSISRTPWTDEEDDVLIKMWRQVGKRWNLISKELKGRPAVHCRNRWQSLFRIGKVDGTSLDHEPEFALDDDALKGDEDGDEGGEVFLSPTDSIDVPRLSASSSSSSSPTSSHLSTPIQTSHTLTPGLADSGNDSAFLLFHSQSKREEEDIDFIHRASRSLSSLQHPPLLSPQASRPTPTNPGFFDYVDSSHSNGNSEFSRPSDHRLMMASSFNQSTSSSHNAKSRDEGMSYRLQDNEASNGRSQPQASSSGRPALFMVPHPNMRILSGPDHSRMHPLQQHAQSRTDSQQHQQSALQFNYGVQHPPSPQQFFLPSYDSTSHCQNPSVSVPQNFVPPLNNRSHAHHTQLLPLHVNNSNNFMMTCPLVHCGFQSANLIDLWKHVTWDHVGLMSMPPSVGNHGNHPSRQNFDLDLNPDFGADGSGSLKADPGMMDYLERIVLDVDSQSHQHQHHDKRGEVDVNGVGYSLGLQLDDLESAAASMGVCGRAVNVSSA